MLIGCTGRILSALAAESIPQNLTEQTRLSFTQLDRQSTGPSPFIW